MDARQHIYAILRTPEDWASIEAGEPHLWSYDKSGHFKVEPEVLAARGAANVWTESGYDTPPRTYPALAVRVLNPPVAPAPSEEPRPRARRQKRERPRLTGVRLWFSLPPEAPEQLDCLCEAYGLESSAVVARLVAEAYRRDVVETGLLAVLADDSGIIAPV